MQTYGIFAVTPTGMNIKDDRDNGWVADIKWAFMPGARPGRKFELTHMPTLKGAAAEGGSIKLEITPRLDGEHLPPVLIPVHLRGNITVTDEGAVQCITRVTFDEMETAGLGVDAILGSSNCLECTVSNQPTLDESIQAALQEGQPAVDAEPLFGTAEGQALPEVNTDEVLTEMSEVPGGPPMTDTGAPPSITLDPKADGEDLPFPINNTDGAAD